MMVHGVFFGHHISGGDQLQAMWRDGLARPSSRERAALEETSVGGRVSLIFRGADGWLLLMMMRQVSVGFAPGF